MNEQMSGRREPRQLRSARAVFVGIWLLSFALAGSCSPRSVPYLVLRADLRYVVLLLGADGTPLDIGDAREASIVRERSDDRPLLVLGYAETYGSTLVGSALCVQSHVAPTEVLRLDGSTEEWVYESGGPWQRAAEAWNCAAPAVAATACAGLEANITDAPRVTASTVSALGALVARGYALAHETRYVRISLSERQLYARRLASCCGTEYAALDEPVAGGSWRLVLSDGSTDIEALDLAASPDGYFVLRPDGQLEHAIPGVAPLAQIGGAHIGATRVFGTTDGPLLRLGAHGLVLLDHGGEIRSLTLNVPSAPNVAEISVAAEVPPIGLLAAVALSDGSTGLLRYERSVAGPSDIPWRWYARLPDVANITALVPHRGGVLIGSGRGLHYFHPQAGVCGVAVNIGPVEHLVALTDGTFFIAGGATSAARSGWLTPVP